MAKNNFLIYGSYGYSGNLIAELACQQGLRPVLAGRDKTKLMAQAKRLGLEFKHFDISNMDAAKNAINDFITVIHCAGPFIHTHKNMAQACIETHTHYMDITGEYNVIENLSKQHQTAVAANMMLLPGAGFDVVPSDCLALYLKNKLPSATQLTLAIHATQSNSAHGLTISRGTARTAAENMAEGSMIRDAGVLKRIPLAWKNREFNFGDNQSVCCTTISWGDLASAWWSTKIPHIETYLSTSAKRIKFYKLINPIKAIFKWAPIKRYIENKISKMSEGPAHEELKNSRVKIYGEVINAEGKKISAVIQTPNAYEFTALSVIHIVKKTLAGNAPIGFQTPSTAYSADLVLEIDGTKRIDINQDNA